MPHTYISTYRNNDTEDYVLDIGLLYEAPSSGEESLAPFETTNVANDLDDKSSSNDIVRGSIVVGLASLLVSLM